MSAAPMLPSIANAALPARYEAAKVALAARVGQGLEAPFAHLAETRNGRRKTYTPERKQDRENVVPLTWPKPASSDQQINCAARHLDEKLRARVESRGIPDPNYRRRAFTPLEQRARWPNCIFDAGGGRALSFDLPPTRGTCGGILSAAAEPKDALGGAEPL